MLEKEVVERLSNAMVQAGMTPPTTVEESKNIRFSTDGGKEKNGWYSLKINDEGMVWWAFGDLKTGSIASGWYPQDGLALTTAQEEAFDAEAQTMFKNIEQEQQAKQDAAKIRAAEIWGKTQEVDSEHPYIRNKRISPLGMGQIKNTLIVPIYGDIGDSENAPVSLQFINESGDKRFLSGGKVAGGLHCIGDTTSSRIIYIAEGYANGATIHEATGKAVFVAFYAVNMQEVCEKIKAKFPDKKLIVAVDNDLDTEQTTGNNRGKGVATKIFDELGIEHVLCPVNSDFNDLFNDYENETEGYKAVAKSLQESNSSSIYSKIIDEFNAEYAITWFGNKCVVLKEEFNQSTNGKDICFTSEADLRKYYANKVVPNPDNPKKTICVADYWLRSPKRRDYKKVIFEPNQDIPDCYNLWNGLAVKPVQGDWSLFKDHIFKNITNGKQVEFEWVMGWIARMLKDPGGERPGTAIVLRGERGTGKSLFVDMIGKLLGCHYLQLAQQKHLLGKFNHHLKNKVLVFADEAFCADSKQSEAVIKHMITEPNLMIEPKGKDASTVRNCINLIIASNNLRVVPAGLDERRFYVTDVSSAQKQNHEYFKALSDQMNNGGLEAMLYDLLLWEYDLQELRKAPKTEALFDQIQNSMKPEEKFWYERLEEGTLKTEHDFWQQDITCGDFYDNYLKFLRSLNKRSPLSKHLLGKAIKKLCLGIRKVKAKAKASQCGKRNRPNAYRLPPLDECRRDFEKIIGMTGKLKWEDCPR